MTREWLVKKNAAAHAAACCCLLFDVQVVTSADKTRIGDLGIPLEDFLVALDAELVGNADQGVMSLDLVDGVAGLCSGLLESAAGDFVHFVKGQFCAKFDITDVHHVFRHVLILLPLNGCFFHILEAPGFHILIRRFLEDGSRKLDRKKPSPFYRKDTVFS